MVNAELVGLMLILVVYVIGASIVFGIVHRELDDHSSSEYYGGHVISKENETFLYCNDFMISFAIAVIWIFFYAYKMWRSIGRTIYEAFIIKDDEEDRIAAWVF